MPRFLNSIENEIRKKVSNVISRGKIDVFIAFENYSSKGTNIRINKELAKEYIKELKALAEATDLKYDVNVLDISKFPEILKIEEEDNEDEILEELLKKYDATCDFFIKKVF